MKKYLFLFFIIVLVRCKKERQQTAAKIPVTYTCYSKNGKFLFSYKDAENVYHNDTIYMQSYTKHIDLTEDQFAFTSTVHSLLLADSLYIKGEYSGKAAVNASKSPKDLFSIWIQLSQAK